MTRLPRTFARGFACTTPALVAVALGMSVVAPATAQVAAAPGRLSLDVNIGFGFGSTEGRYLNDRTAVAAGLTTGLRVRPLGSGALVAAVGAGVHGFGKATSLECIPIPPGECLRAFPGFAVFSAEAGWESQGGMFRAQVGPALARSDGNAAAVNGRLDLSRPVMGPFWFVASGHGTYVPDYRGDSFSIVNVSIGVRVR